uniref:energy-coupling factor ABC transporter substrate-binding protein n=1 Tax=Proteocatella sphenisci TaxID=181070 RepID=UPI002418AE33
MKSEEPKGKKIASASSGKKSPLWKKNVILLVVFFIVVFAPLAIKSGSEFGGADGIAMDIVTEIDENYQPNFEPFFEPASGEIESLLFALQAALGAGVIGFGLGRLTKKES